MNYGVAVVGSGLIGKRRSVVAAASARSTCVAVADTNIELAKACAADVGAEAFADWRPAVDRPDVALVVVATPNAFLADVACYALEHGKHVLIEKPMGRNIGEAERMAQVAGDTGRTLKIGFNHRYHPAIFAAHALLERDEIGSVINARFRYGHGGRAGYENEWRGNRELAGGGELTDQGVHVADLLHWFAGAPIAAFGMIQTAVWPLGSLEDNGFGLFRFPSGAIASLHTSWTQWKNLFSMEIFGTKGMLAVEGLGKSYGTERLIVHRRRPEGGVPVVEEQSFEGEDLSWAQEWDDFLDGIEGSGRMLGTAADGLVAMRMLDALYRSVDSRAEVAL